MSLARFKPAARARTQLLLAALLWSLVGAGLATTGGRWVLGAGAWWPAALGAAGVALGLAKGRLALEAAARRIAKRIARRGDGTCLGGFLSWKTWLLILTMMGLGATLRHSDLPRAVLGVAYVAIGVGLLWGSRLLWTAWKEPT